MNGDGRIWPILPCEAGEGDRPQDGGGGLAARPSDGKEVWKEPAHRPYPAPAAAIAARERRAAPKRRRRSASERAPPAAIAAPPSQMRVTSGFQ